MSVPSLSFAFGELKTPCLNEKPIMHHRQYNVPSKSKRKMSDEDELSHIKLRNGGHRIQKFKPRTRTHFKKHKSQEVSGEPLPLRRIIETLDHDSLQQLVLSLIDKRPDITPEVMELAPKITVEQTFNILNKKMDSIKNKIPYKVDPTSDYSYLRVQKQVVDFFNSFSDYMLNFLSPVEKDVTVTLKFLNEFLMNIFYKMPVFQNEEFKFFYNLSVEKLNHIFIDSLIKFLKLNKSNILIIIKDDWLNIVAQINELNHFNFQKIFEFLKQEINSFNENGYYHNSDLEDDDEQEIHKLKGLNNLMNFFEENTPLIGGEVNETYLL